MTATTLLRWGPRSAEHDVRLFCFPHAGSGPAPFLRWAATLGPAVGVAGVCLPGHERSIAEPRLRRMDELTDRLVAELLPHLGPRFALFGHSLGALVAFSLCRSLEALGRAPAHLFLSGAGAPHCGTDGAAVSTLPDDALIAHVRRLGGLPSEVLEYDELVALLLPVMRDDFELAESYRPLDRHRLTTPVTALAGLDDRTAPPPAVRAWRDLVDGPFDVVVLPGAHFFVLEHEAEVLATIQTRLRPDVRVLRRRHDIEGDH